MKFLDKWFKRSEDVSNTVNYVFDTDVDPFMQNNDEYLSIIVEYGDWNNPKFESIFNQSKSFEFNFFYKEKLLNEGFKVTNVQNTENIMNADYYFRYSNINVFEPYRNIGVCSYMVLKSIITLLEKRPHNSFEFSLVNTVKIDIGDKHKIYDSILTEYDHNTRMQYRLFSVGNRKHDIIQLKDMLERKRQCIISHLSCDN